MHERRTILKEVKALSKALLDREKKLAGTLDRLKAEKKRVNKTKKQKNLIDMKKSDQIEYLQIRIEDLKRNEEMLIQDLASQQKCANEALRSLETLTEKMDEDKTQSRKEIDEKYQELMQKEKEKFEIKVKYLMSLNETLNSRVEDFQRLEPSLRDQIASGKDEIKSQNMEVSELKLEVQALQNKIQDHRAETEELMKQVKGKELLQQQLHDMEDNIRQQYAGQLDDRQRDLRIKKEEMEAARREISLLDENLRESKTKNASLEDKIDILSRELFEEKTRREDLQVEVERMRREVEEKAKYESMKLQVRETQKEPVANFGKLSSELNNLRDEISNLKSPHADRREMLSPTKTNEQDLYSEARLDNLETKLRDCFEVSTKKDKENFPAEYLRSPEQPEERVEEQLKSKDDEVKVLWTVIKELNKSKESKMDLEKLKKLI